MLPNFCPESRTCTIYVQLLSSLRPYPGFVHLSGFIVPSKIQGLNSSFCPFFVLSADPNTVSFTKGYFAFAENVPRQWGRRSRFGIQRVPARRRDRRSNSLID